MSINGHAFVASELGAANFVMRSFHVRGRRLLASRNVGPSAAYFAPVNAPTSKWFIAVAGAPDAWVRFDTKSATVVRIPAQQPEGQYLTISPSGRFALYYIYDRPRNVTGYGVCDTTTWKPIWEKYNVVAPVWATQGDHLLFARLHENKRPQDVSNRKRLWHDLANSVPVFCVDLAKNVKIQTRRLPLSEAEKLVGGWYAHYIRYGLTAFELLQPLSSRRILAAPHGEGLLTKYGEIAFTDKRGRHVLQMQGNVKELSSFDPICFSPGGRYVYGSTDFDSYERNNDLYALIKMDVHTGRYDSVFLPKGFARLLAFVEDAA